MPKKRMQNQAQARVLQYSTAKVEFHFSEINNIAELATKIEEQEAKKTFLLKVCSVETIKQEFLTTFEKVQELSFEIDEDYEPNFELLQEFYDKVNLISSALASLKEKSPASTAKSEKQNSSESRIKLKRLEIPKFDGKRENWPVFYQLFNQLVHTNDSLSKLEKINYLVTHLEGSAKTICSGILPIEENYEALYEALETKFEDKRALGSTLFEKILNFKTITQDTEKNLSLFLESFIEAINALKQMKIPDLEDFLFFHIALTKLDSKTRLQFEDTVRGESFPSFKALVSFVQEQARILERTPQEKSTNYNNSGNSAKRSNYYSNQSKNMLAAQHQSRDNTSSQSNSKCVICDQEPHNPLYRCPEFRDMPVCERWKHIRPNKVCSNCLTVNHHSHQDCGSENRCRENNCGQKHHTLLHQDQNSKTKSNPNQQNENAVETVICSSALTTSAPQTVLLATALVKVKDKNGKVHTLRALLDNGSMTNMVTPNCAQKLNLPQEHSTQTLQGIGPGAVRPKFQTELCFFSALNPAKRYAIKALVTNILSSNLPCTEISRTPRMEKLMQLQLADPTFHKPGKVDLLLGASVWTHLFEDSHTIRYQNLPPAIKSTLGYIIMGSVPTEIEQPPVVTSCLTILEPMEQIMQKWLNVEDVPKPTFLSATNKYCEEHFLKPHYLENGQFSVARPFQSQIQHVSSSRATAASSFISLKTELLKNSELHLASVVPDFRATFSSPIMHDKPAFQVTPRAADEIYGTEPEIAEVKVQNFWNKNQATSQPTNLPTSHEINGSTIVSTANSFDLSKENSNFSKILLNTETTQRPEMLSNPETCGASELLPNAETRVPSLLQTTETSVRSEVLTTAELSANMILPNNGSFKVLGTCRTTATDVMSSHQSNFEFKVIKGYIRSTLVQLCILVVLLSVILSTVNLLQKTPRYSEVATSCPSHDWTMNAPQCTSPQRRQFQDKLSQVSNCSVCRLLHITSTSEAMLAHASGKAHIYSAYTFAQNPTKSPQKALLSTQSRIPLTNSLPQLEFHAAPLLCLFRLRVSHIFNDCHTLKRAISLNNSDSYLHFIKFNSKQWILFITICKAPIWKNALPHLGQHTAGIYNSSYAVSYCLPTSNCITYLNRYKDPLWSSQTYAVTNIISDLMYSKPLNETLRQKSQPSSLSPVCTQWHIRLAVLLSHSKSHLLVLCSVACVFRRQF